LEEEVQAALHRQEEMALGDARYQGVERRPENAHEDVSCGDLLQEIERQTISQRKPTGWTKAYRGQTARKEVGRST
jgi:hypothetical protein